tara:strand:+ start:420 stop:623 length:204 start_codon:yes stop_codon:yes gene_type:complete
MTEGEESLMYLVIGYVCLFFGGFLGLHRFYFGRWFTGFLYICTGGFCGIGVLVDIFLIPGWVAEKTK